MYRKPKNLFVSSGLALILSTLNASYATENSMQSLIDVRQEAQLSTTYTLNPYLRADNLKVNVKNGKATLTGVVPESVNKELAEAIALGVDGIKEVDNQIKVISHSTDFQSNLMNGYADAIDDATITAKVKSKLLWSRYTEGLKINVSTKSGRVTLTGTADGTAAKELAERLAMHTRGVVSVNNALVISQDKGSPALIDIERLMSDGWITTKVKSTLLYSSNVAGVDVEVATQSGVVTLSGTLGSGAEKALAIEYAENVRGVRRVNAEGLKVSSSDGTR
jgi:osmotically-inducible protein OsmY